MSDRVAESLRRYTTGLRKRDELGRFIDVLNDGGEAYLFGGAARDVAFGARKKIHDLDIFVSGNIDLDKVSRFSTVQRNNFGGLRLYVSKMEIDAWELQRSYPFISGMSPYVSVMSLLKSVCFSTDGIAVSLKSGRMNRTDGFLSSLKYRYLDFVVTPPLSDPTVATRIARLVLKLDLFPSKDVANYFMDCYLQYGRDRILKAEERWGYHRMLTPILLEQIRCKFEAF